MHTRFRSTLIALFAIASANPDHFSLLHAQGTSNGAAGRATTAPIVVTLMLVEEFSTPGTAAVVQRTSAETVIAIKRSALTPAVVGAALLVVPSAIAQHERVAAVGQIDIRIPDGSAKTVRATERIRLQNIIGQLRSAQSRDIPRGGRHPAIVLTL